MSEAVRMRASDRVYHASKQPRLLSAVTRTGKARATAAHSVAPWQGVDTRPTMKPCSVDLKMRGHRLLPGLHGGPLDNRNVAIRCALQRGRVQAYKLPPPPQSGFAFFRHGREPVLPKHNTNLPGRFVGERIVGKSSSTSLSFESNRTSVFGTIGYSRQEPNEANQRFQSNRG